MENVYYRGHVNCVRVNVSEHINVSANESLGQYERRQYMLWFDEKAEKFLDQRNQAKLQLQ